MAFEATAIIAAIVANGREVFARDGRLVITGGPLCAADDAVIRVARDELLALLDPATDFKSDATRAIPLAYPSSSAEMGQDSGLGGVH